MIRLYLINTLVNYTGWNSVLTWHAYSQWCLLSVFACLLMHLLFYISRLIVYMHNKDDDPNLERPNFFYNQNNSESEGILVITLCANIVGCFLGIIGFYFFIFEAVCAIWYIINASITGNQFPF